jgi:putative ABC transport system ATP-binding protein
VTKALVRSVALEKTFGEGELATPVLRGVSIEVLAGELVLLMGPSGSGKTTLISILAGLLRPTAGRVELCGSAISELHEADVTRVRRRHLGFVFQSYNLFPALTALDNIAEVLKLKGLPRKDARERAKRALAEVGLADRLHHRPGELSGGQKQRVAIARALAGDPALILGDEVTAALDTHTALQVLEILRRQITSERGILLVTHDRRLEQYADRVIEIEDGRIARVLPGGAGAGAAA